MKLFYSLPFLFSLVNLFAQNENFLKVEYEVYDKIYLKDNKSDLAKELEKQNNTISYYQLILNENESYFSKVEKIDNAQNKTNFSISTIDNNIYMNTKTNEYKRGVDYNGTKLLIIDTLTSYKWQLHRETKNVLGQEVKKATFETKQGKMTAWYAPKLPYKNGPIYFNGLPGLILEFTYISEKSGENMEKSFRAISINKADKKDKIEIPTKGKIVNSEGYYKAIEEINQKMSEMYSNKLEKD